MKTRLLVLAALFLSVRINAQTVSTFESLTLEVDSFWNGVDMSGSFSNGNAVFKNDYHTSNWGDYWGGFSYSNTKDSITPGSENQYSARAGAGFNNSSNYAVGQGGGKIILTGSGSGKEVSGFYVTNTTYAVKSMEAGDQFAKKFGGVSGNDPDWFMLTVKGWYKGGVIADSVNFYLADYRASNNSEDYIVKNWEWVNLTSLGNVDSLIFNLSSSDNSFGFMNTPSYFAMDNFTTLNSGAEVNEIASLKFSAYPNPVSTSLTLNFEKTHNATVAIYDAAGKLVLTENMSGMSKTFDVSSLTAGIYFISVSGNDFVATNKFIKQ
ncbi:MAG: DUF4465 domain-containing protein [Bacteroidetes bacterium]|nr:DUF4465 domain-containing protein [Bacteroidota bacterium]